MTVDPITAEAFSLQVERFFASLISAEQLQLTHESWVPQVPILGPGIMAADSALNKEPSLGGKLFYAGKLDAEARALVVAANISGAATLTASAEAPLRKQAMRDGVADFLVTTLDEALRILKNEIRKRETVAVCVAQAPDIIEQEMRERGVLPDILRAVAPSDLKREQAILLWRVASSPALWLPKIDAIVSECLPKNQDAPTPDSEAWNGMRRWLRLAPRYLGPLAPGVRVLRCHEITAARILDRLRTDVNEGRISSRVEVKLFCEDRSDQQIYGPQID